MSDPGPLDDNPFEGVPLFGDLAKMFQSSGPINWEAGRQFAIALATGGTSEPNVDPVNRQRFAELSRIAELHVADATGRQAPGTGIVVVVPVTRGEWTTRTIDDHSALMERLAAGLQQAQPDAASSESDPAAQLISGLTQMLGPVMMAMTVGSMIGHLATNSLSAYPLPIPRPPTDELPVPGPNVAEFGREWSVPDDDLHLWICIHELAIHSVLTVAHVNAALVDLLNAYVSGFESDPAALERHMGSLEPSQMGSLEGLQELLGDPEILLGAIRSPAQADLQPRLDALVAAIVGYIDHLMDRIGNGLIGSYSMLTEALRRRRVTTRQSDRFVEKLLGLELDQALYDRGRAFIDGIEQRAGADAIERLWSDPKLLPTPNEVDAPGLWLARIDL